MLAEIVFTSPNKEVTQLLKKLQNEMNLPVSVIEETFGEAVTVLKDKVSQEPNCIRVIASGGQTLRLLQESIPSAHFVDMFPTEYEIVLGLDQARKSGKRLGLFLPTSKNRYVIENLCAVLEIQVNIYVYTNLEELELHLVRARHDGCQIIMGSGDRIGKMVEKAGLQYIDIMAGESTLRKVLEWAKNLVEAGMREKMTVEKLNAVSMYAHEGIIMLNKDNIITVCNPVASKMFGLSEAEIVGKPLQDLNSGLGLVELVGNLEQRLGFLHQVPSGTVLVNKFPLIDRYGCRGILLTLIDINNNQGSNKNRKELLTRGLVARYHFEDIIYVNSKMSSIIEKAKKFANTDCTILIRGESGTGKELLAQSIHNKHSVRCKEPFVAVNCAALDSSLFNSEIFGYTEGSFTGASKGGKPGLFEQANGGTLFLDEIGKMTFEQQGKLLRVLQEKVVRRIGSDRVIPVDVRVIAASNENLEDLVKKGSFREDLYFRLNVLSLVLPPLRERKEDISAQVAFFLRKFSHKYNKLIFNLPADILDRLSKMDWPGNSRQLEHFIEKCVVLADDEGEISQIVPELLDEEMLENMSLGINQGTIEGNQIPVPIGTLAEMSAELVRRIRATARMNNSELASKLGISRPTLLKILNQK